MAVQHLADAAEEAEEAGEERGAVDTSLVRLLLRHGADVQRRALVLVGDYTAAHDCFFFAFLLLATGERHRLRASDRAAHRDHR
jgi:hypothetical protein